MSFIPKDIRDKDKSVGYIKTDELLKGTWEIINMEIITANNPKFGAEEKDALCKNEVLTVGQTLRYTLKDPAGVERNYETKGLAFYLAFKEQDEDLAPGSKVTFHREGTGQETRWEIKKV